MIVGMVLFAFAMKNIVAHVGEELDSAEAFALCGASALYLLTYSATRTRFARRLTLSRGRFVAALVLLVVLSAHDDGPVPRSAGARHRRVARVARVRARVAARRPRGITLVLSSAGSS
jgi:hypothetical protein